MQHDIKRFVVDVILLLSVFWLAWWVVLLVGLLGILLFRRFFEIIVAGVLLDLLYGAPVAILGNFQFIFTVAYTLLYVVGSYVKKDLRWYGA